MLASSVTLAAKVVAMVLHEHMDWRGEEAGGNCWPSLVTLAAETNMDKSRVAKVVNALDEAGFIARLRGMGGRGHPTQYVATLPVKGDVATPFDAPEGSADASVSPAGFVGDSGPERVTSTAERVTSGPQKGCHHVTRPTSDQPSKTFRSSSGSTDVDAGAEPQTIEELDGEQFDTAFLLGRRVAELCNNGVDFVEEVFRDLVHSCFGFADERDAWAGLHRYRCTDRCRCHNDDGEVPW